MDVKLSLRSLAYGRSGDKGANVNIGLVAKSADAYEKLVNTLTETKLMQHFCVQKVTRFLWPKLHAINFVLEGALGEGGGLNLRMDSQGKVFAEALLDLELE